MENKKKLDIILMMIPFIGFLRVFHLAINPSGKMSWTEYDDNFIPIGIAIVIYQFALLLILKFNYL